MKSTLVFRDQINILASWFDAWNSCEQTVAMYTMFRKLKPGQIKFLLQVLQQSASECTAIQKLEAQANNPVFVSELCSKSKDYAMHQLLECLPLLQAGSHAAKAEYLAIIPKILSHSVQNMCHIEESRQLLSYCLIHPAITAEERGRFTQWLVHLEERNTEVANNTQPTNCQEQLSNIHYDPTAFAPTTDFNLANDGFVPPVSNSRDSGIGLDNTQSGYQFANSTSAQMAPVGRAITSRASSCAGGPQNSQPMSAQGDGHAHRKLSRSVPITPPTSNVSDWLNKHHEEMSKLSGSSQHSGEPHAPLSPQSSVTSSGSDCHEETPANQRNTFLEDSSGMRDVPIWLKSLRLHKYAYIFQQLSYDEMLNLSEEWLESQNVTKGARHKIVLSINKLKDRQNQLRQLEKDVMDCCNLRQALQEVKTMLNTPIKQTMPQGVSTSDENQAPLSPNGQSETDTIPEGDIPGQITRLMGKLCTQLLVTTRPEDDCFGMYLQLLDKCMMHEAWMVDQKKKLASWKQQIQKTWHPSAHKYIEKQRKMYTNALAQSNLQRLQRALRGQQMVQQPANASKWTFGALPANLTSITSTNMVIQAPSNMPLYRNNSFNASLNARSPLYELQTKQPVSKTNSVPLTKSNVYGVGLPNRQGTDVNVIEPEMAARLDSLCLSMTEHAIGNFDSPEKGSTL